MDRDPERRKKIVWEIERKLAEDAVRPVTYYPRGGSCLQPWLKGLTIMVNSIYNGWRFEDEWPRQIGARAGGSATERSTHESNRDVLLAQSYL
jgi:hypothetical protein